MGDRVTRGWTGWPPDRQSKRFDTPTNWDA